MRRLRKGEYDLVNISLIGHDPMTGRSYEECHDEWSAHLKSVREATETMRWWQIRRQIWVRWQSFVLAERFGAPPGFLA